MKFTCHLILADGCGINYISRSALLNRFIERLITVCSYSAGYCSDSTMTIYIDIQSELKDYCLSHPGYIAVGSLFAVSFGKNYTETTLLIDNKLFNFSHQVLIDIALSMIGTVNYVMLVAAGHYSPAHCTLIEINGKGALICAPSGVGKSTCATRLPVPHRVLADDCALLMWSGDDFIAQAMPTWSRIVNDIKKVDSVQFDCSASVRLTGIFFLEQSSTDTVKPLNSFTAQGYLNSSFNDQMRWFLIHFADDEVRNLRIKMFSLAERITAKLPTYRLCATLDGKFWDVIHKVLR